MPLKNSITLKSIPHAKITRFSYRIGNELITFKSSINWFDFNTSGGTENFGTPEDYRRKVLDIYIEDFSFF